VIAISSVIAAQVVTNSINEALIARGEDPLSTAEYAGLMIMNTGIFLAGSSLLGEAANRVILEDVGLALLGRISPATFSAQWFAVVADHLIGEIPFLTSAEVSLVLAARARLANNTISGFKFDDKGGDGLFNLGVDPLLPDWTIILLRDGVQVATQVTNSQGEFRFTESFDGNYELTEHIQTGWVSTTHLPLGPIAISGGSDFQGNAIGNFQVGEISGFKYEDVNGSGTRESGEQGLFNWTIVLKNATSGVTIDITTTDSNGFYMFANLTAGTYRVEEEQQQGYTQTAPSGGFYEITVQSGTNSTGNNFGNMLAPQVVFQEKFDSGTSGWSQTLCQLSAPGQQCLIGTYSDVTPIPSSPNWGASAIVDNIPGDCAGGIQSRHSKTFTVAESGDYEVKSWMWTAPCSSCNIVGRLFIDGMQVLTKIGQNVLFNPPQDPSLQTAIVPLSAGEHTVSIGTTSPAACFGLFRSLYDDITITRSSSSLMSLTAPPTGGPYHSVELNQTSANVTRPDSVTIELEVGWYDPAWSAEPVQIVLGNMTGTNIGYTIESIYNSSEYQIFEITFDITAEVQAGDYAIPIIVNQIDTLYTVEETFLLRVE
jgi:hypothetical protein